MKAFDPEEEVDARYIPTYTIPAPANYLSKGICLYTTEQAGKILGTKTRQGLAAKRLPASSWEARYTVRGTR